MAPGARKTFGTPIFETKVFPQQMYCIEVLETLLRIFDASIDSEPGGFAPLVTPWTSCL